MFTERAKSDIPFAQNNAPKRPGRGKFSPLLRSIVIREFNSVHKIAEKYKIRQEFISRVLHGKKTSKRVEQIISTEWGITLKEFQAITQEWLQRQSQGLTYTPEEIKDFGDQVRARRMGISIEELQQRKEALLGPISAIASIKS